MFENRMTDMIAQQTRLRVVDGRNTDLHMEGEITNYQLSPQAVGEDAYASQTRLTITVRVRYTDNKNQAHHQCEYLRVLFHSSHLILSHLPVYYLENNERICL
jgi:hypothetical protein